MTEPEGAEVLVEEIFLADEGLRSGMDHQAYQAYAWFAGILAGFAFAGLVVYLGRSVSDGDTVGKSGIRTDTKAGPTVTQVATTLFYAMSSLTICTFLYISLVGEPNHARAFSSALLYGPVLGLSVLSLFYSMTLMMLEHEAIRETARYAYLVVVIAGPILVIRFLVYHSNWALQVRCSQLDGTASLSCGTNDSLWLGGILVAIFLFLSLAIKKAGLLDEKKFPRIHHDRITDPTVPPLGVFLIVSLLALFSVLISVRDSKALFPDVVVHAILICGFILLALFSILVCLCYKKILSTASPSTASPTGS